MAAKAIQWAWKNRRTIKRKGSAIVRYVKKRKTSTKWGSRMKVVEPKQRSAARSDPHVGSNSTIAMCTLQWQQIVLPGPQGGFTELGRRDGLRVYVKGIKICRQFEFLRPSESVPHCPPIIMHYAVVQLKDASMDGGTYSQSFREKFFRSFTDTQDRIEPFIDNTVGSGWSSKQNCLNMNPDSEFNILTHMRRKMVQRCDFPVSPSGPNVTPNQYIWHIEKYMKIKKSIAFDRTTDGTPIHPIFDMYWYQTITPSDYPSHTPSVPVVCATWKQHTVYYSDKGKG